jgi:hypothetical protein
MARAILDLSWIAHACRACFTAATCQQKDISYW